MTPISPLTSVQAPATREMRDAKALWIKIDHFLRVHSEDCTNMARLLIKKLPADQRSPLEGALKGLPSAIRASPAQAATRCAMLENARALVACESSKLPNISYESIFPDNDEFR